MALESMDDDVPERPLTPRKNGLELEKEAVEALFGSSLPPDHDEGSNAGVNLEVVVADRPLPVTLTGSVVSLRVGDRGISLALLMKAVSDGLLATGSEGSLLLREPVNDPCLFCTYLSTV